MISAFYVAKSSVRPSTQSLFSLLCLVCAKRTCYLGCVWYTINIWRHLHWKGSVVKRKS